MAGVLSVLDRFAPDGGPMRSEVEPELLLHATQELGHAELVLNRIIQLGGTPGS
jgi:bacterioferritin (cytochrome b1)